MKTNRRYRILYVSKASSTGGGSTVSLYELVRALDTNLYEPIVLFYGPNPYREHFKELGARVITLKERSNSSVSKDSVPTTPRNIAASLRRYGSWLPTGYNTIKQLYSVIKQDAPLAYRIARLIKHERIDLVHLNRTLQRGRATVLAARLARVPLICHVRMLHNVSFIDRYLSQFVNGFIYISRAVECCYQEQGIPVSKGQVIYNPFDIEAFSQENHSIELRSAFGLTEQTRLISNIGRISSWKGQDYFLEAMAQVVKSWPNTKVLIVGGPDPEPHNRAYYQKLQDMVTQLQLSDYITFTGFRSDIPQIMATSDIVVHSSSEPEPFGRVIVEAMLAGKPVIATSAGGVLDIVEDKATGLLVPPKNSEQMAQAIEWLLNNREQAEKMGAYAQQNAETRFSVEQHVTAVQQLYQKILAK